MMDQQGTERTEQIWRSKALAFIPGFILWKSGSKSGDNSDRKIVLLSEWSVLHRGSVCSLISPEGR